MKIQIQMEKEMKNLAETTTDGFRDIFDKVCLKNPSMAARFEYSKTYERMRQQRKKAEKL